MRTIGTDSLPEGTKLHKFEAAGLGKAPYKFIGMEVKVGPIRTCVGGVMCEVGAPGQPMGSCQYCGTGIKDCYYLRSADGKEFYVGSDCIKKAGDKGLYKCVTIEQKKKRDAKNAERRKKDMENFVALKVELAEKLKDATLQDKLAAKPHPMIPSMTLLNYVEFLIDRGGLSGKMKAKNFIEAA